VLHGPEPSQLEVDLAKVEQSLKHLQSEDVLSNEARELRGIYYAHWRDKLRLLLLRGDVNTKQPIHHGRSSSSSRPPNADAAGYTHKSPLNQVEPSGESWKVITPPGLLLAVMNIRDDFKQLSDAQRGHFEERCFKDLHPLTAEMTEPAVFAKHFRDCVGKLCDVVPYAFSRLLDIALNQNGLIGRAPVEWASLQVTDLIEHEDRMAERWVKSVCDPPPKHFEPGQFMETIVYWTHWRAPKWLYMRPNGYALYVSATAWERMDEAETRKALRSLRENRWILLLESTLEGLVGIAHEKLAKRKDSAKSRSHQPSPQAESTPSERFSLDNIFVRQGNVWSISYAGRTCLIRHQLGLEYIARLLRSTGRPMTAVELRVGAKPGEGIAVLPAKKCKLQMGASGKNALIKKPYSSTATRLRG
jgi:hypothetical protein